MIIIALLWTFFQAPPEITQRMQSWSRALGVECAHCHVEGDWSNAQKPTFAFAQRMDRMVRGLNAGRLKDFGGISCVTCHRGQTRPARLPRTEWEAVAAKNAAVLAGRPDNLRLRMSVYSSSLGVGCDHCHESGAWAAVEKPAMTTAQQMAAMFDELPTYFTKERMPTFQCYMCHQGAVRPTR